MGTPSNQNKAEIGPQQARILADQNEQLSTRPDLCTPQTKAYAVQPRPALAASATGGATYILESVHAGPLFRPYSVPVIAQAQAGRVAACGHPRIERRHRRSCNAGGTGMYRLLSHARAD